MNPEKLLDAMQYLPDELLEQTDRLRRRKPFRWQPLVATAACLCLLLSVAWSVAGGAKSSDGAAPEAIVNGSVEDFAGLTGDKNASTTTADWQTATVVTAEKDCLTVTLLSGKQAEVLLTSLSDVPELQAGQMIRLYLDGDSGDRGSTDTLTPYKIEIMEVVQ